MILSPQQLEAVYRGEAVPIKVDQTECVVLRKDIFQAMRQVSYDDSDWSDDEMARVASEMFEGLDQPQKIRE